MNTHDFTPARQKSCRRSPAAPSAFSHPKPARPQNIIIAPRSNRPPIEKTSVIARASQGRCPAAGRKGARACRIAPISLSSAPTSTPPKPNRHRLQQTDLSRPKAEAPAERHHRDSFALVSHRKKRCHRELVESISNILSSPHAPAHPKSNRNAAAAPQTILPLQIKQTINAHETFIHRFPSFDSLIIFCGSCAG
jgi:hypothetical protein